MYPYGDWRRTLTGLLQEPKNVPGKTDTGSYCSGSCKVETLSSTHHGGDGRQSTWNVRGKRVQRIAFLYCKMVVNGSMYEIPSDDTIEECVVTKAAVDGESEPLTIHEDSLKKAK